MCEVSCNYRRDKTDTKCPLCKKSENTTEHVLECEKDKVIPSKESSKGEWEEKTEIYRKNKKKRELAIIKIQDQNKIIKESRKKNKIRKTKKKEKCRKISRKKKESQEGKQKTKKETEAERECR